MSIQAWGSSVFGLHGWSFRNRLAAVVPRALVYLGSETDVDSPEEMSELRRYIVDVSSPVVHVFMARAPHRGLSTCLYNGAHQGMDRVRSQLAKS
ncbi:hypothetical protein V5799_003911 [Amblyomma americanum]|uniref:Uncharacterized protein n=1 Tax=Amblyomma americanum TaxID=6943 RepID=A0AAQ4D7L5_AMBAM